MQESAKILLGSVAVIGIGYLLPRKDEKGRPISARPAVLAGYGHGHGRSAW
jgi:hypothetical protein